MKRWILAKLAEERERRRIGLRTFELGFWWICQTSQWQGFRLCFCLRLPLGKDHAWGVGKPRQGIKGWRYPLFEYWFGKKSPRELMR